MIRQIVARRDCFLRLMPLGIMFGFVVGIFNPQRLWADTCGEYVLVNGQVMHRHGHELPQVIDSGHKPSTFQIPAQSTAPIHSPCHGPKCSSQPLSPMPTSTIVLVVRIDALIGREFPSAADAHKPVWPDMLQPIYLNALVPGIFRPPCC